jgi:hypothetical protein
MRDRHLREIVEIVGVISIVAALLLVAWEIHQANRIAVAQIEMRLGHGFDELHLRRATTPDFAKLYPKMRAPGNHLVTATEASQIEGLAEHLVNIYYSAQVAHDNGLLGTQELESYRQDLAQTLEQLPGLAPAFARIHDSTPEMRAMPVFQPLRTFEVRRAPKASELPEGQD